MTNDNPGKAFFEELLPHAEDRWIELSVFIAQEVNKARDRKGWTQRELANRAGIQAPHLSRMLSGHHNFTIQTIAKIEAALETPLLEVCHRKALSFAERGLPATPTNFEYRVQKYQSVLADGLVHPQPLSVNDSELLLNGTGNTPFAMAA